MPPAAPHFIHLALLLLVWGGIVGGCYPVALAHPGSRFKGAGLFARHAGRAALCRCRYEPDRPAGAGARHGDAAWALWADCCVADSGRAPHGRALTLTSPARSVFCRHVAVALAAPPQDPHHGQSCEYQNQTALERRHRLFLCDVKERSDEDRKAELQKI